jgi:hypothetical protein
MLGGIGICVRREGIRVVVVVVVVVVGGGCRVTYAGLLQGFFIFCVSKYLHSFS